MAFGVAWSWLQGRTSTVTASWSHSFTAAFSPAGSCTYSTVCCFLNMSISVHVTGLWQLPTWMKPAAALMLCLQLSLLRRNMTQKLIFPQRRYVTDKWLSTCFSQIFPAVTYSYWQYYEIMRTNWVFSAVLFKGELAVCLDRALLFLMGFCLIVILKTTK